MIAVHIKQYDLSAVLGAVLVRLCIAGFQLQAGTQAAPRVIDGTICDTCEKWPQLSGQTLL